MLGDQKRLIYDFMRGSGKKLLIVLDACNFDVFIENIGILEEKLVLSIGKAISSGSCTKEWLLNTFTESLDTIYVTANPFVTMLFSGKNMFKKIVDVSKKFWDKKLKTVRAEYVNLVAMKYLLEGENVIVHYIQPHAPFIDAPPSLCMESNIIYVLAERNPFIRQDFRNAYYKNMQYILRHVRRITIAALKLGYEVVITADHSELLGKYSAWNMFKRLRRKNILIFIIKWLPYLIGWYKVVGHPCKWYDIELYTVPWIVVKGL